MVYCKYADAKKFTAFNLRSGRPCQKVFATMVENTPENQRKLQEWADYNKDINLVVQLRWGGKKVVFQTS